MRILVVSDIHGSHKALERLEKLAKKADLIIITGDFTILSNHIEHIMKQFNSLKKKVLIITGNHENPNKVKILCDKFSNLYFMNNKIFQINNLLFYGYSTNGFSFRDTSFERDSHKFVVAIKKAESKIKNNKPKSSLTKNSKNQSSKQLKTILISHAPPFGTKADKIMDEHCGNKSVREVCIKHDINYCFSGHIHEGAHTVDKLKKTIVVNPGPYGMVFEI